MANRPPIRYVSVTVLIPEDCAAELREFFERKKTGRTTLHVDAGHVRAVECTTHHRVKSVPAC